LLRPFFPRLSPVASLPTEWLRLRRLGVDFLSIAGHFFKKQKIFYARRTENVCKR
jgi:hypothetical protein